jgi:hypothetical protein
MERIARQGGNGWLPVEGGHCRAILDLAGTGPEPGIGGKDLYRGLRCGSCVTRGDIAYDRGGTFTIFEHARSCRWLRRIAARYGN